MATAYLPPQDNDDQRNRAHALHSFIDASPITLILPDTLYRPLWKSLLLSMRDRVFPPNIPPLRLTSTPVDVITPVGRMLATPWYRTILSNIGDIVAPESLPPLVLES